MNKVQIRYFVEIPDFGRFPQLYPTLAKLPDICRFAEIPGQFPV